MQKCDACPLLGRPEAPCLAQTTNHARFCHLVSEGRADYRALILAKSGGAPAENTAPQSPQPGPQLEELRRKLELVQECPNWVRGSGLDGCGCGENLCRLGKGRPGGFVRKADCFSCLNLAD